jgi:hypothetical protein
MVVASAKGAAGEIAEPLRKELRVKIVPLTREGDFLEGAFSKARKLKAK